MTEIKQSDLLLTTTMRDCEKAGCKEKTFWMRPKQRTLGHCLDHAIAEPVAEVDAFRTLLRAFPGSTITEETTPRYAPDEYGRERVKVVDTGPWLASGRPHWSTDTARPLDAGPCEGCRRIIRRYGPEGYPYCTECEPIT